MIRLRFVFSSIYKRIETNLQREEAVAGEVEVLLACHSRPGEKELVEIFELGLVGVVGKVKLVERFVLWLVGMATKSVFSVLIMKK